MALLPLDIPAGFYRNGTDLEQSGRWREGSLVRWMDGSLRPVGGWSVRKYGFTTDPVRGMHTWQSNGGTAWVAGGSANSIVVMTGAGVAYELTPDDLPVGRVDANVSTGYGYNYYGTGTYGQPRPVTSDSIPEECTVWVLDNFGEILISLCTTDGRILKWDLTTVTGSELVTNGTFATDSDWTKGTNWSITTSQYAKYAQYKPTFDASDATIVDPAADTITITGHEFVDGDEVTYNVPASPASAYNGLTNGTNYFIVNATANNFKLAATSGGTAINLLPPPALPFDADDETIKDVTNNKIVAANIFANGDYVTYTDEGGVPIGGLADNQNYYIVNRTASEFQLSDTSGGTPIDLTPDLNATANPNILSAPPLAYDVAVANVGGSNIFTIYSGGLNPSEKPALRLIKGQTYVFDVSDPTNATHPIGFFDGATAYTSGVTVSGTEGQAGATVTFAVPTNAPTNLTYQCLTHGAAMGNTITVVDEIQDVDYVIDRFNVNAHGFITGRKVKYTNGSGSDIGGLTDGTEYFVVNSTPNSFKLSATFGGSVINLTAPFIGLVTAVNFGADIIGCGNAFSDGDEVQYFNGNATSIPPLVSGQNYFIRNRTSTTFQLSETPTGAIIDLTGAGEGNSHTFTKQIGTAHNFDLVITSNFAGTGTYSPHVFTLNHGNNHELERINFGNLDQTVSGLVATPDAQDSHDLEVTIVDLDHDNNSATVPVASIKVVGTTSTTELINQNLFIGKNVFRFGPDDTEVKLEIIPGAYNTPNFYIDNVTLKQKTVVEPIANAPINNKSQLVTEERFIFALGAGGNSRKVQWCDKENINDWTPAATNEAGDIELQTAGQIMQGIRTRAGTLILTDTDSHLAIYVGPPYVYSFSRISTHSGAISRLSAIATDQGAFWMGQENFFYFDGNSVQVLPCDVHDYVFGDFNSAQQSKVWAFANGPNNEVWWFYCSESSLEIDRYVAYDYREKHWLIGNLSRTAGASRGVFAYPFLAGQDTKTVHYDVTVANDNGNKFYISTYTGSAPSIDLIKGNTYRFKQDDVSNAGHPLRFSAQPNGIWGGGVEYTTNVTKVGTPGTAGSYTEIVIGDYTPTLYFYCSSHSQMGGQANILEKSIIYQHEVGLNYDGQSQFAETGPISLQNGDTVLKVNQIIPDEKTQGDVQMSFKTRFHPNDTERTFGPFNPTNPTSLRFTGRQIRMRVTGQQAADWRVGVMRLEAKPGGTR